MIRTTFVLAALLTVPVMAAERPLLDLVPPGAKVIAGIHVNNALGSPLGRHFLAQIKEDDPGFRKFIEATGFDPRKDLREIVLAAADPHRSEGVVLARGVFNGPQILKAAQEKGGTLTTYKGIQVLQTSGEKVKWVTVLSGAIAAAGPQEMVKAVIDANAAGSPGSALTQKAGSMNSLYDAWFVATGMFTPKVRTAAQTPTPPAAALEAILESSGGVEFGTVVRVTGEAVTRSEKDAQALIDVVRFMTSMLTLNRDSNPQFPLIEPVLNGMELTARGNTVRMVVSIQESDLEQLLKPKRATARASR